MEALIPAEDLRAMLSSLPMGKVERVCALCAVCEAFLAAPCAQRAAVAKRLAEEYAGRGLGGMSLKRLYAKAARYRAEGWRAFVPATSAAATGIARNEAFLAHWHDLVTANQRVSKQAFDRLIAELRAGLEIPGYGDWRAIWRAEHPGRAVPEACPYKVGVLLPQGWSLANLMRHKPSKWALTATRTGTLAAANLLPGIPRTRAGLKRGQIVEVDDMWHDVKVRYGNAPAERCIELAMLDVATGYRSYLLKPIRRREDGTREGVMARMMPYLLGYWLICQGYCPEGALLCGEHNTAALSKPLAEAIERATGGKVRFAAGGKLSQPLAKGLWEGKPRGNFRFKARLEGSHALVHNALGSVPGQVGYTRENAPEALYAMDKAEGALQRACAALAKADPDLPNRLRWPYIPYADYAALVAEAVTAINARTEHALEGWEAQGFTVGSFRLGPREPWRDLAELEAFPEGMRAAILAQLQSAPELTRARRLSPAEAWDKRAAEVVRADRCFMPLILGEALAMRAVVSPKLELKVKDPAIDLEATVVGLVTRADGSEQLLERGAAVMVWINPLEPAVAYLAEPTANGPRYLGTAPVMTPAHQDDAAAITERLKLRSKVQALERRAILPYAQEKAAEKQDTDAWNAAQIAQAKAALAPKPAAKQNLAELVGMATQESRQSTGNSRQDADATDLLAEFGQAPVFAQKVGVAEKATTTLSLEDFI